MDLRCVPLDEQLVSKVTPDGKFLIAAKVVDTFLIVSTCVELEEELYESVRSAGYKILPEFARGK